MGGCLCKTFTVNKREEARLRCIQPFIFSVPDAESVLMEADMGDYLLYRDHITDKILLSVRYNSHIRHHRITELNSLFYLNGQPYPYLDSIVLYHRKHRLDAIKLKKQAHLSARIVRLFAHKITSTNGNNIHTLDNEQGLQQAFTPEINGTISTHHLANGTTDHHVTNAHQLSPASTGKKINAEIVNTPTEQCRTNFHSTSTPSNRKNSPVTSTMQLLPSNLSADIAGDLEHNNISLSSWTNLDPGFHVSELNCSTTSSQASLLSRSSSNGKFQVEHL